MDFKIPKFDELKDRLGMGSPAPTRTHSSGSRSRDAYGYDSGFEDYGEYAYDESADYAQEESAPSYSANMPKLITSEDVRAHTQYTPSDSAESISSQATRPNRDFKIISEDSHRSPGVNSLFEPSSTTQAKTSPTGAYAQSESKAIPAAAAAPSQAVQPSSTEGRVTQRAARVVTIIKPETYADAERIAKVLKSGDVAVLSLRNTQEALGKRILDFSFGVACALDAQVECVSGHVFAITRGAALSDAEMSRLKAQGLM